MSDIATDDVDDVESLEEDDDDLGVEQSTPEKRARHAITGRGVTLQMLMADGIIQHGEAVLSLEYLGQKFTADLLPNGKIKSNETDQVFGSPSSWAIFCKKLVNPAKKSGCGWASVKYKGRKLDSWKTSWFRQMKPRKPNIPGAQSPASSVTSDSVNTEIDQNSTPTWSDMYEPTNDSQRQYESTNDSYRQRRGSGLSEDYANDFSGVLDLTKKPKSETPPVIETIRPPMNADVCFMEEQEEALNLSLKSPPATKQTVPQEVKTETSTDHKADKNDRKPVNHSTLPERSQNVDTNVLVECEQFSNIGKIQPYTVSMATNSLLLMDFHCHLTTSEVVGYLGGKWDQSTQHLSIQQAFPCRCRLGDSQNSPGIEDEIKASMKHLGMSLVGWYHSHPYCLPEPSIKDVDCQMSYQLRMKGSKATYFPCVGMINSPYYGKSLRTESSVQMYMVMPPSDSLQTDFGIPMALKYTTKQNHSVSEELLSEMKKLTEFYRGSPDWITFQHSWHPSITYLEKLKINHIFGLSAQVVIDLTKDLAGKGHTIYTDNFYTSPKLAHFLSTKDIYICGTMRTNRIGYPKDIVKSKSEARRLPRGFYEWRQCESMVATSWKDNKMVYFLSTAHVPERENLTTSRRNKDGTEEHLDSTPTVQEYCKYMGGVDRNDQMTKLNKSKKSMRWYRKIERKLLEMSVYNSYIIEGTLVEHDAPGKRKRDLLSFKLDLAHALVGTNRLRKRSVGRARSENSANLLRLDNMAHYPAVGEGKDHVCVVCNERHTRYKRVNPNASYNDNPHKRCKTTIKCTKCDKYLCCNTKKMCFTEYHTMVNL